MPEPSCFFQSRNRTGFPVPWLAFEHFMLGIPNLTTPESEIALYTDTLQNVLGQEPSIENILYLQSRLTESIPDAPDKEADDGRPPKKRKSFGHIIDLFVQDITPAETLLLACNYDYAKAYDLYAVRDFQDAKAVLELYLKTLRYKHQIAYEQMVYGFGGHYEGDEKGSGDTMEVSDAKGFDTLAAFINSSFGA